MKKGNYYLILAIGALIIVSLACGSSNSGVQVGTSSAPSLVTSTPLQIQIYHAGDVIQVGSQTIVLNTASIGGNELQANFTIENKGSTDINASSMVSFEAKGSDGTKLQQDIFNCPAGGLDGKIIPGDKLKGNICWTGVSTDTVKIYYTADLFGQGATVWEISK